MKTISAKLSWLALIIVIVFSVLAIINLSQDEETPAEDENIEELVDPEATNNNADVANSLQGSWLFVPDSSDSYLQQIVKIKNSEDETTAETVDIFLNCSSLITFQNFILHFRSEPVLKPLPENENVINVWVGIDKDGVEANARQWSFETVDEDGKLANQFITPPADFMETLPDGGRLLIAFETTAGRQSARFTLADLKANLKRLRNACSQLADQ